jgi:dolichol-phosphate mannosyltransferase
MSAAGINFELILVDDGSNDGSFEEIKRLSSQHSFIRGFRLSRNFGHQAALHIGLQKCRGSYIAIIDDDLQDPPEILPTFFEKLYGDVDVVYGIRKKRKENLFQIILYSGFYRILNTLSSIEIPLDAGDFCAMRKCVVEALLQLQLANLFLRGTRAWAGFRQLGVEYERSKRFEGKSGYSFRKYIKLAITGMMTFSYIPLRLSIFLGLFITTITGIYSACIIAYWLFRPFDVPGYLSIVLIVTLLGGTQLICLGIIGEYLSHVNDNARRWPIAFIAETTEPE